VNAKRSILIKPLVTEKIANLQESQNKVAFVVDPDANKIEIRKAVETKFKVKVKKVATVNLMGKNKRMGKFQGRRTDWKKAIVTLQEGFKIDFVEGK
jgi:large subunit ribosomal protein L23